MHTPVPPAFGTLITVASSLLITLTSTSGVFLAEPGAAPRHPLPWQMGDSLPISLTRPGPEAFQSTLAASSLCKTPLQKCPVSQRRPPFPMLGSPAD